MTSYLWAWHSSNPVQYSTPVVHSTVPFYHSSPMWREYSRQEYDLQATSYLLIYANLLTKSSTRDLQTSPQKEGVPTRKVAVEAILSRRLSKKAGRGSHQTVTTISPFAAAYGVNTISIVVWLTQFVWVATFRPSLYLQFFSQSSQRRLEGGKSMLELSIVH